MLLSCFIGLYSPHPNFVEQVIEEPSDCLDAVIGGSSTFTCQAESQDGPVTYQWMHDDKLLLGEVKS